ncbi:MAG: hypothetical protein LUE26_08845 [Alistipes sp.]|nr:hypothetical protein [Alistipes sp.]
MSINKELPLLIDSKITPSSEHKDKWCPMKQAVNFIRNIRTSKVDEKGAARQYLTLVSGIPTPWARAKIFNYAIAYISNKNPQDEDTGLIRYFEMLVDEWKGLLAAIAIKPDRFTFSAPVTLADDPARLSPYPFLNTLGTMLFEDKPYWIHTKEQNRNNPKIQLLYYNNKLVGATSPFTIFFTGVNYGNIAPDCADIPWFDREQGMFINPDESIKRDGENLQKLFIFVNNIIKNHEDYKQAITENFGDDRRPDLLFVNRMIEVLSKWSDRLRELAIRETNKELSENGGVLPHLKQLEGPLSILLRNEFKVYWNSNSFSKKPDAGSKIIESLDDLFIPGDYIAGWNDSTGRMDEGAVYYLKVKDYQDNNAPVSYFALPLSKLGLEIFGNSLKEMLQGGMADDSKLSLTAEIKKDNHDILAVKLTIEVDGEKVPKDKEFQIRWIGSNRKVMIWPNFVSNIWNKYYLYSEYPSNEKGTCFIPEYKTGFKGGKTIDLPKTQDGQPIYPVKHLVKYPIGEVSSDSHHYEILQSEVPFERFRTEINEKGETIEAGYLVIKDKFIEDKTSDKVFNENSKAIIGFDFGSNNTCVNYAVNTGNAQPIPFSNRRVMIVGHENESGRLAESDELLFFSNEGTFGNNGQVKSWLHEHDIEYIQEGTADEIAGGVPVNEKNICVVEMTEEKIRTQVGNLYYDMKWLSTESGINKKTAFIKTLWTQICADLYAQGQVPETLRWSYPSSMITADVNNYSRLFNSLAARDMPFVSSAEIPRVETEKRTESEAVCSYALTMNFEPTSDQFVVGIDVGGSTSDILIIGKGSLDGGAGTDNILYSQSSVRLAAGVFFKAIINSPSFRRALVNFHKSGKTRIHVENIEEIIDSTNKAKGPYFLNNIFDQLQGEREFYEFYDDMFRNVPYVFTIPAYVTGLLVCYSGMLTANVIRKQGLEDKIKYAVVQPFGKGGRLFDWMNLFDKDVVYEFYSKCFSLGMNNDAVKLKFHKITPDNKSEVSKGLVAEHKIVKDENENYEVWGEAGVKYIRSGEVLELGEFDNIDSSLFENVENFDFTASGEVFRKYMDILSDLLNHKLGVLKDSSALYETENLRYITSFFRNDREYRKVQNEKDKKSVYSMPILIAEGLHYLEEVIIPKIFNR